MRQEDNWLPDLITFEQFNGDWNRYCDALYALFRRDFIEKKPKFLGQHLCLKRHPLTLGRECTFWHLIQEGDTEDDRVPNFRRCERIEWISALVTAFGVRNDVKAWRQVRPGKRNIIVAPSDFSYKIVLTERSRPDGTSYLLLWTAYPIEHQHERNKMKKESLTSPIVAGKG